MATSITINDQTLKNGDDLETTTGFQIDEKTDDSQNNIILSIGIIGIVSLFVTVSIVCFIFRRKICPFLYGESVRSRKSDEEMCNKSKKVRFSSVCENDRRYTPEPTRQELELSPKARDGGDSYAYAMTEYVDKHELELSPKARDGDDSYAYAMTEYVDKHDNDDNYEYPATIGKVIPKIDGGQNIDRHNKKKDYIKRKGELAENTGSRNLNKRRNKIQTSSKNQIQRNSKRNSYTANLSYKRRKKRPSNRLNYAAAYHAHKKSSLHVEDTNSEDMYVNNDMIGAERNSDSSENIYANGYVESGEQSSRSSSDTSIDDKQLEPTLVIKGRNINYTYNCINTRTEKRKKRRHLKDKRCDD